MDHFTVVRAVGETDPDLVETRGEPAPSFAPSSLLVASSPALGTNAIGCTIFRAGEGAAVPLKLRGGVGTTTGGIG